MSSSQLVPSYQRAHAHLEPRLQHAVAHLELIRWRPADHVHASLCTGDAVLCERGAEVVRQLKVVQDKLGSGYLSAFPTSHFDRLEALQPVWAPYYVASTTTLHDLLRNWQSSLTVTGCCAGEAGQHVVRHRRFTS